MILFGSLGPKLDSSNIFSETNEDVMLRSTGQTKKPVGRRNFIGGSDARIIMGDDESRPAPSVAGKTGRGRAGGPVGNLVVQLGSVTEDLNRRWYEFNTGLVVRDIQKQMKHPTLRWMAATLDGVVEGTGAVFEAKFMLPWAFSEEAAAAKHMAQLQHNMWVIPVEVCRTVDHYRRRQMGRTPRSMPIRSTSI